MREAEADGESSGLAAIVTQAAQYDMSDIRSIKMDSFEVRCWLAEGLRCFPCLSLAALMLQNILIAH